MLWTQEAEGRNNVAERVARDEMNPNFVKWVKSDRPQLLFVDHATKLQGQRLLTPIRNFKDKVFKHRIHPRVPLKATPAYSSR